MTPDQPPSGTSNTADDYFRHYLNRTIMLLGEEAVQTLRRKTVGIAGCGGHGGATALTLARMGVGNFILADPKPFDEPDINRQWAANRSSLGRNKADVYAEMLREINPEIGIKKFCEGVTNENAESFLEGADLLIDCLDIAVPGALRKRVFVAARANGIHAFTGAMLGFGGMLAGSSPGGLPLELLGGIEDVAITGSKLPQSLKEIFVPEFMDRVEEFLHIHRAPSIAISPALLGIILSVESAVTLLGNTIPGWRPPVCLPHLLLVDLLKLNFRIVHLDDLILKRPLVGGGIAVPPSIAATTSPRKTPSLSAEDRLSLLATVGFNTNLIPYEASDLDLLTDSWSEIPNMQTSPKALDTSWSSSSPAQAIEGYYGYKYVVPVFRGRFAEALLCKALARPGAIALTNTLFPTTRFHLESNGFTVQELVSEEAYDPASDLPFKGDLDIQRLQNALDGGGSIGVIYIEFCVNALGGHPVSLANLSKVYALASARGIPVILDTARAFENAALIKEREPGLSNRTLTSIVREMCSHSYASAGSCAKDFRCAVGGFVAMNNEALFTGVRDLTLALGDGLAKDSRQHLLRALAVSPESACGSAGRVAQVQLLWKLLRQRSVPISKPCGGHAVFVDACRLLPHIPVEQFPAQALANELFVAGGIGAAPNFTSPELQKRNVQLLRLAIPIDYCGDEAIESVARAFEIVMAKRERIKGLKRVGGPPGVAGEFAAEYRPTGS